MPHPLSRVNAQASIVLGNAGHRALSERPKLAVLVSEAIGSWSNVESFLMHLFVQIFGGNESLAARVYLALEIQTAKTKAIEEAIKTIEDEKTRQVTAAIVAISKTNQKARDKLAHHIWGISPNLPDALLLVDPKAVVTSAINYDEVYVYRENDLQSIIAANDRLCGYGLDLQFVIKGHVANRDGQLLTELCSQPEVAERLNRLGGQDRTAQEESP